MTFWLRRWHEQSRRPTAHAPPWPSAMTCTSTWRAGADELLEQHGAVAEGLLGLGLRAGERGRKRLGLVDAADAAPAAPRRRLDHEREADARGVPERLVDGLDGTAAPRRHRHAGFFGEPLGGDLVAEQRA